MAAAPAPGPDYTLRGHEAAVNCICFVDSGTLVSGSVDGELRIWQLNSRRGIAYSTAHAESVISVATFEDMNGTTTSANKFISSGRDECVKVWDIERMTEPIAVLHTGARHFCNIAVNTGSTSGDQHALLASPCADEHRALIWDIRSGSVGMTVHTSKEKGTITTLHLATEHSSYNLFVGHEDGTLSLFDLRMGTMHDSLSNKNDIKNNKKEAEASFELQIMNSPESLEMHDKQPLMAMDLSRDGRTLITGAADTSLVKLHSDDHIDLISTRFCSEKITKNIATLPETGTSSVKIRTDDRIAITGHWDGTARIWDVKKKMKPLAVLTHHRESVFAVAFKDGIFATASKDSVIALWSVYANTFKSK